MKSQCAVAGAGYDTWTLVEAEISGLGTGPERDALEIKPYDGEKSVFSLEVCPLSFFDDAEDRKRKYIERDRKVEKLRGYHFQEYKGTKHLMPDFAVGEPVVNLRLVFSSHLAKAWENFMNYLGRDKFEADESDLDGLSKLSLNGREIKNLIKTAQLLSRKTGGYVTSEKLHAG